MALLLLALMLMGMFRLVGDHERLVKTLDRVGPDPLTLWVRPHDTSVARTLGRPALLLERSPKSSPPAATLDDAPLTVLQAGRDLESGSSWVLVEVTEVTP